MTLWCFLSWGFTGVLLELDEGLYRVLLPGLSEVHGLDQQRSLEWVEELLCEDNLQCGELWQKWWILWWQWEVLLWWHPLFLWCDLEQPLWELWWLWLLYLHGWDCDLDLLYLYLSQWWHLEVDLVWCLVLEFCLWWCVGVPDGGILSGQSATMWPY